MCTGETGFGTQLITANCLNRYTLELKNIYYKVCTMEIYTNALSLCTLIYTLLMVCNLIQCDDGFSNTLY